MKLQDLHKTAAALYFSTGIVNVYNAANAQFELTGGERMVTTLRPSAEAAVYAAVTLLNIGAAALNLASARVAHTQEQANPSPVE